MVVGEALAGRSDVLPRVTSRGSATLTMLPLYDLGRR
jgi:hypothetical protein